MSAAVLPLPQFISGSGLMSGNAKSDAALLHSSCRIISNGASVLRILGTLRSARREVRSESMVWCSVLSTAWVARISESVCLLDDSVG